MPASLRYLSALFVAVSPLIATGAHASATDDSTAEMSDMDRPAAFAVMDMRASSAWVINHFQWLAPNEEALETLVFSAGKGPMRLDFVMDNIVPSYCELSPDPENCDGPGVPVSWMEDVPQTICMDIPLVLKARHKDVLKKANLLCLQPRSNLLFPDDWIAGNGWPQVHLHQTVRPRKIRHDGTTAIIDLVITDAIATGIANLSEQGYGPATIGMSDDELRDVIGPNLDTFIAGDDESCTYLQRDLDPSGLGYMVLDGKLARVSLYGDEHDVATSLVRTRNGLSIGSTKEDVYAAFAGHTLIEEENEYLGPDGRYVTWWQDDAKTHGIRFEIDENGTVIAIHAGSDAITLIEGCV
ncbi:MAG: hypothetical protein JJ871_04850 [Thalassospira sp.]|uniref:hypothetical protein n=1 Tax=Thalassospira sp. TaxID=1912094 RepID=UPI001B0F154F|nr:hypothetical protein [Thalassospira sp.]MBO6578382.1 hypothetical protein [Thalassospira sp.]MBO6819110.1 hypothetical protein [Thalassospira sp.]MBO6887374.1 hypothetical protein [Thalassospira sp.]